MKAFHSITHALQRRGIDLLAYQEFLSFEERFERLSLQLHELQISPKDYFHFLNSQESETKIEESHSPSTIENQTEESKLQKLGNYLLIKGYLSLEELNQVLQHFTFQQITPQGLLHRLMQEKKLSVDAFVQYSKTIQTFCQKDYLFRRLGKGIEFYPISEVQQSYGKYQVLEELARGGMGIVYKAYHPELNQVFALKVLQAGPQASERSLKRFHREIQTSSKLQHPNLVKTQDCGVEGENQHYFVMEYVEGKTLRQWLQEQPSPSIRERIEVFVQLLDGLGHAHEQGIIHRDLKPGNILLNAKGQPKLTDFGLAKDIQLDSESQKLTRTGALLGTPMYMAPEQVRGEIDQIDSTSDLYSLAVCLYEALTGSLPYTLNSKEGQQVFLFKEILQKEPVLASQKNPDIHPDLDYILARALEKQKSKRYLSAQEFQEDLARFLMGLPLNARIQYFQKKAQNLFKRGKIPIFSTLFLIVFFSIFYGFQTWNQRQQNNRFLEGHWKEVHQLKRELEQKQSYQSQIRLYFQTLSHLEQILQKFPEHPFAQKEKKERSFALLQLACRHQEYLLANYALSLLKQIPQISLEIQQKLEQSFSQIQNRQWKKYQKRFTFWETRAKSEELSIYEQKDLIMELSQKKYPQLLPYFSNLLEESGSYFFHQDSQTPQKTQYYLLFLKVMTYLESPVGKSIAITYLKKLTEKLAPIQNRSISSIRFMVQLTEFLAHFNQEEIQQTIYQTRLEMGQNSLYWDLTKRLYKDIATHQIHQGELHSSEEYFKRALMKRFAGDYDGAIQDYSEAIKRDPQDALSYGNRGYVKFLKKDYLEAIKDFDLSLQLQPNTLNTLVNRGLAKKELGNFLGAIEDYNLVLFLDPKNFVAYSNRGQIKYQLNDIPGALEDFQKSIDTNPQYPDAYFNRGTLWHSEGKIDFALKDYETTIELNPNFANVYNNRAMILFQMKDTKGAMRDYDSWIRLRPNWFLPYLHRGRAKEYLEDFQGAEQDYSQAILLDPKETESYLERGKLYQKKENVEQALKDFQTVLQIIPYQREAFQRTILIKMQQGKMEEALNDCHQALLKVPNNPFLFQIRGEVYQNLQKRSQAFADFSQAIKLNPQDQISYFLRSNISRLLNKEEDAIRDLNQAIHLNPNYENALFLRGALYYGQKEYAKGIEDFQKVLQVNPKNEGAYNNLGKIYQDIQLFPRAHLAYQRAIDLNPNYPRAYYNRINLYILEKNYFQAIEDFNRLLNFEPVDMEIYFRRGVLFYQTQQTQKAYQDFVIFLKHITKQPEDSLNKYQKSLRVIFDYFPQLENDFSK